MLCRARPIINVQASLRASVQRIAPNPEGNPNVFKHRTPQKTYELVMLVQVTHL